MILYIHDHKFIELNGSFYSEGKFTTEVFSRYDIFNSKINVISRVIKVNEENNLNLISNANVNFKPVKGLGLSSVFIKNFFYNLTFIMKEVKNSDAIIVRLPSFLGIFTLLINLIYNKKYFIEFVGDPKEALLMSKNKVNFLFKFFVEIFTILNRFFVNKSDGVIFVTKYDLQKRYPTNNIQSYASNVELTISKLEVNLDAYKLKHNKIIKIGMIGSFNNEYKGIDIAFNAIKKLKEQNIIVNFHILGSGILKEKYINLAKQLDISQLVYFDGVLSGGTEVNQWLDSLDLYIQPSRTEGLPRSLIEAMARGLPAVATNVGGIPELLPSEFLIPTNVPQELANKIELLISSQQLRYEQGKANYNKAREYDSEILRQRRTKFWSQAKAIVEKDLK